MRQFFQYISDIQVVSSEGKKALEDISLPVIVKKNMDLQPIGHTCKNVYFVNKGALRIYYFKDGIDVTESFEFETSVVARAESLFSGKPSRKAIQAIEDTEVIAINAHHLFELFNTHHDLERLFRKIFEAAYVKTVNRIESLQFHSAEERYLNLLHDQPDVMKRVPLKHVASFLGITQVSLSRIRAKVII